MSCQISAPQVILVIVVVFLIVWFIRWLFSRNKVEIINVNPTPANIQPKPLPTSQSLEEFSDNKLHTLYHFYSPSCPHCINFSPAWDQATEKLAKIPNLSVKKIDGTKPENDNLTFYYDIKGYPTVILATPTKNIEYSGNRTSDDIYQFVIENLDQRQ